LIRLSLFAVVVCAAHPVQAQERPFTLYYQNVPLFSLDSDLTDGGASDFNRFRVMADSTWKSFTFEAAYEHVATFRQNDTQGIFVGQVPGGGEWLELQWTVTDETHVLWQHRFDRLAVGFRPTDTVELSVGRQTVSWATTLFLTPSDPFSPFNPADPFRQFRAGVDAVRARFYPNALSEIDVVVRPTENDELGVELTTLGRGLTTWHNWEVSAWGGSLYGDVTGAFGAAGSIGSWALRGEAVVRELDDDVIFRGTIGVDRRLDVYDRELYIIIEYQRDGLGARRAEDYLAVLKSDPFLRGELQVLGRDEIAFQGNYQLTPLASFAAMSLWNLGDGSVLLSPSFSYSVSDEASITGGMFLGFGDGETRPGLPLPSEYGAVSLTAYGAFSLFF